MNHKMGQMALVGLLAIVCFLDDRGGNAGVARAEEEAVASTTGSLYGGYGYDASGTVIAAGDYVANGVITFHPDGTLTAVESANFNGQSFYSTYTGWYTVNAGNTGTITTVDQFGGVSVFDLVLTANRYRGSVVQRDEGVLTLLKLERQ
jgi:hypothetical protein